MESNNKWNQAAINGLSLSLVTIIYSLINSVFTPNAFIAMLLWAIKFGGCIYLLHLFMKQYSAKFEQISYSDSFKYGFIICCFSSVVCAAYSFLSLTLIFPDSVDMVIEQTQTILAQGNYSSEEESAVESVLNRLPQITLFTSLVYYIIIGAITSAIIANYTKKTDPFADFNNKANTEE